MERLLPDFESHASLRSFLETDGFPTLALLTAFLHGETTPLPDPLFCSSPSPTRKYLQYFLAARLGLEPRYTPPEGAVLPLDDLAISYRIPEKSPFYKIRKPERADTLTVSALYTLGWWVILRPPSPATLRRREV